MNILECYGVGTVAMDKDTNTDEIQVHIKSLFPETDGAVETTAETKNVTTQTPTGDTNSSTTLQTNTISAKWMGVNTNRVTAPDVRVGSKVVIYKFQGQNTFRWTYFGMDGTLRLETIIWAFSSSPNVNENSPVNSDNYYMMLLSTHQKKIQLITGQGNGEPTSYVMELNTGTGQFSIVDGEENVVSLNSMAHAFSYINAEKTFFNFEKKNITMSCEDTLIMKATDKILMQCKDMVIKAGNSINVATQATTWDSPTFNLKGNVTHEGNYDQTGNTTIKGSFSQSGGAGTVSGGWTIDNVTYIGHVHKGVQKGGSETDGLAG
ncbi:baseplate assembly protein [Erwinia phage AH04]|uniref:Baseplate assembly protein n=1 Tax=Erwinia phage AH04 TaxID=2869569 RepID=A0AAE8BUQ0_9CAUD|nr:baseplate assembly protein [Erwinia phage AH04]QZA70622.1 baseplate assembly protein [Erwinia phage AH04]